MHPTNFPRIVIAGLSGDSGKTLVSCGLLSALRSRGLRVSAFKKGPDYIDAAWLTLASGRPARNLDTHLMGVETVTQSFQRNATGADLSVIEGNRGLFDGVDSSGTHSTAELAKLLHAPVIIVLNVSKVTRTAAASVLGCVRLDPEVRIAGVILNNVANERHVRVVKEAIEDSTGVPVLGAIPKLRGDSVLPTRHLGLVTPGEFRPGLTFLEAAKRVVEENADVSALLNVAGISPRIEEGSSSHYESFNQVNGADSKSVRIAYFKDESFSFYYPENLEMLLAAGAEIIPVSPSREVLPDDVDALYIGGGFPELYLTSLVSNREMMSAVRKASEDGMPIYAECGGLIYLARSLERKEKEYDMSGVLPIKVRMLERPQGHGYTEAVVDEANAFFERGSTIRGHEFHYSNIVGRDEDVKTCLSVSRGAGCFDRRDGISYNNVFATYTHIHALATSQWAGSLVKNAMSYKAHKSEKNLLLSVEG